MLRRRAGVAGPAPLVRILAGLASAGAAIGVGHLVAALTDPAASPLLAVGSVAIDAAPTPAKEFVVRTLGNYDKPVLVGAIALLLAVVAALLGLIAWGRRSLALLGIGALGVVGAAAAVYRLGVAAALPSLASVLVGVATLAWLTRPAATDTDLDSNDTADSTDSTDEARPVSPGLSRRGLLVGVAAVGVVGAVSGIAGTLIERAGRSARRLLSLPAPRSAAKPLPAGVQLPGVTPFTTPAADFYRVDISLVTPRIQTEGWSLTIDGMVDRPITLSYDDLLAMPMIERDITLTCVSNEVGGPYVSSARWLGVPFTDIIKRVGVRPGVDQVFSYSLDSGYTCSTPFQAVSDGRDAMIVVGMNGQPLPDERGFPARMLVPGLFGFVSATKWLKRIEFTTYAQRTAYWTKRKWATDAPILTASRIDVPNSLGTLSPSKPVIAGVAWAQHRGIHKVEIKIDDGPWQQALLADEGGIDLWRQWSYVYDGPAGRHSAQVRATDRTGAVQPENRTRVFPSGATGWHQIQFQAE
ncbi:MAG TPA: molybdopterin-dependent oxidoreductase [Microlunatus sp.]